MRWAPNRATVTFRVMYRLGFKPWDSGVSPPELKELIEGPTAQRRGRALDLGCGTGTNVIYMAQHGWEVTGIDFVPRALAMAKRKAAAAKVSARLIQGDVTRLADLGIGDGFALVFDLGCLHSIPDDRRGAYAAGVTEATLPGADFLVWGFYPTTSNPFLRTKLSRDELEQRFGQDWEMVRAWGGEEPGRFAGSWYHLRRR
jgi:SAM-dependent methyltransferase